jgi:hypothetical protein
MESDTRKKIRRINLFGPPCSGKSRNAAWLFSQIKTFTDPVIEVDWVQEACKYWTYIDRPPAGYSDQLRLFAKNLELEEVALRKVDVVVCDAPLLMNCFYGWKFNRPFWLDCVAMSQYFEQDYPSLNIFLNRGNLKYSEVGRFQNESQANEMHGEVKKFVTDGLCGGTLFEIDCTDEKGLLSLVKSTNLQDRRSNVKQMG